MKNKWLIASLLIFVLLCVCAASLIAAWQGLTLFRGSDIRLRGLEVNNVSAQVSEEQTLSVSGAISLTVKSDVGDIQVISGADGEVKIQADKIAWGPNQADAEAALEDVEVIVKQNGNKILIEVVRPTEVSLLQIGPGVGHINFIITTPAETSATVFSSGGDLSLSGLTGSSEARTDFGKIELNNLTGAILAKNTNGEINAQQIGGGADIVLESEFGSVQLENAQGADVRVTSNNGQVTLVGVEAGGDLEVSSEFGGIEVESSQAGAANIHSSNGSIQLQELALSGSLTVQSSFGDLTLNDVQAASYDLKTDNGKIKLTGAQGSIVAHTEFGDINIQEASEATLDISSANGNLSFAGTLGKGPHTLKSQFGNIQLTIPTDSALNLDLKTEFGKISSDLPVTLSGELDNKRWIATSNGGGSSLTAATNNGNISLLASK